MHPKEPCFSLSRPLFCVTVLFLLMLLAGKHLAGQVTRIVVAQDGSGSYRTVSEALKAVPENNRKAVLIYVRNGVYKEKLVLPRGKNGVSLVGEDKFRTVLTWDDHTGKIAPNGDTINTRTSASFLVLADDFYAAHLTFENRAGFTAGQAVALDIQGDRAIIQECRITGNQDILFTEGEQSRQYYGDCLIEGTTDFIFGAATVWFERCHIHSKKESHVTAASTPASHPFGFVFHDCVLTGDSTLHHVSLGRPWRPYGAVTYLHCYMDRHIRPEGWANWNQTENFKTARYAEYGSWGPGANPGGRVPWSHQLTDEEATAYTLARVLGGWDPLSTIRLKQRY